MTNSFDITFRNVGICANIKSTYCLVSTVSRIVSLYLQVGVCLHPESANGLDCQFQVDDIIVFQES